MTWLKNTFRLFLGTSCLGLLFILSGLLYSSFLPRIGYFVSVVLAIPLIGLSMAVIIRKEDFVLGLTGFLVAVVQLMFVFSAF